MTMKIRVDMITGTAIKSIYGYTDIEYNTHVAVEAL